MRFTVADEERSCIVTTSVVAIHIIGSALGSPRICGTKSQPWTVEAPVGQKISISLFDFSPSDSDKVQGQSKQSCHSYGVIMDKGSKRNEPICGSAGHRLKELFTSTGNAVEIFLDRGDQKENTFDAKHFMLRAEGVCN